MALYGKCNNCGTHFMDAFGEFYDFKTYELICPICGSRDIGNETYDDNNDVLSIFEPEEIEKVRKEYERKTDKEGI